MSCIAFYPGSFDPVTFGHVDIIERAAGLFDELIIGVGTHHGKTPMFSAAERVDMLQTECAALPAANAAKCRVMTFDNLTVDTARDLAARVIVRGLRDSGDFDYEMQMAGMNAGLAGDIETIFLASSPKVRHIAASLVRQIVGMDGDVTPFVPAHVAARLAMLGKS